MILIELIFQCINKALKSDQPKTVILDIIAQLNEDSQKIKSGFFAGKLKSALDDIRTPFIKGSHMRVCFLFSAPIN